MNSKSIKSISLAFSLLFAVSTMFTACGSKTGNQPENTQQETKSQATENSKSGGVSGSVTSVGSSALQPLAEKAAQMFMEKNKDARIQVQGGGSGTGLNQVSSGGADIGNSDVYAAEKLPADKAKELIDHKVCVVGFAAVVNPKVKVDNITKQQLIDIFTGKITNWKDVGGDNMKIVIINRPKSSGTRATFKKYALDGKEEVEGKALTEDQSGPLKKAVTDTEGSISYLAFSYIDSTMKVLKYDGIEPTADNVKSGKYPIWSYEHMYTKGEAKDASKAFIDYISGDEFKPYITQMGYIPNSEMKTSREK